MYVCMYVCMYVTRLRTSSRRCTFTPFEEIRMQTYSQICTRMHVCTYVSMHMHMSVYTCKSTRTHAHILVQMWTHIFSHTQTHRRVHKRVRYPYASLKPAVRQAEFWLDADLQSERYLSSMRWKRWCAKAGVGRAMLRRDMKHICCLATGNILL